MTPEHTSIAIMLITTMVLFTTRVLMIINENNKTEQDKLDNLK